MKLDKRIALQRKRRSYHVRNRVRETGRLRLSVFRSNKNMYAQLIDDSAGRTLAAASTVESGFSGESRSNAAAASAVGRLIAERALAQGVKQVAFDRGAYRYHGRVRALAEAAREAGLEF